MDIVDKIRKIEALIASSKSEGERQAAEFAKQRLQEKMVAEPIEYSISLHSFWEKRLFVAICHQYGFRTYRYKRQKRTTAMVRVSKSFMTSVVWPEFQIYVRMLRDLVEEITIDLISKIHLVKEEEPLIVGELPEIAEAAVL